MKHIIERRVETPVKPKTTSISKKGDVMSAEALEMTIETLAKARADATGMSFAKAYNEVLVENPNLYQAHAASIAKRDSKAYLEEMREIAKSDSGYKLPVSKAEAELNALAETIQAENDVPFATAFAKAMTARPDLYSAYLNQK